MEINEFGVVTDEKIIQAAKQIEEIVKKLIKELNPLTNIEKKLIAYELTQYIELTVAENIIREAIENRKKTKHE